MNSSCSSQCDLNIDSEKHSEDCETVSLHSFQSCSEGHLDNPPYIDIEPFDDAPFSESFSGMLELEQGEMSCILRRRSFDHDISYNVEQITDIQELDSQWVDDDIDEVVVISRKTSYPTSAGAGAEDVRNRRRQLDNVFSLSEFDFVDGFDPSVRRLSGTGTRLVQKRDTSKIYTMKSFRATPSRNWPFELRLLEMLTELDCPFLPSILRRVFEDQALYVLLDAYPAGNLLNYVLQEGPMHADEVLFYISELIEATSVLHDAGIQHRDINPANMMINVDGHIVLSGFDKARVDQEISTSVELNCIRDYEYRAPEVLLRWEHDFSVDCWSLGCVMYFLSYGKHLFSSAVSTTAQVYKQILRGGTLTNTDGYMSSTAHDLMVKCLERNPRLRLNIEDIKQHIYFASVNWSTIQQKRAPAPYIPKSYEFRETFYHESHHLRSLSLDLASEADTAILQTPAHHECNLSPSPKARSLYSLKARHSVQDLLPKIFRSPSLDELKIEANQTRLSEDKPSVRAPSYESLGRSPFVKKLSNADRLSSFWDSLDNDLNAQAPKPSRLLGLPLSSSEIQIQDPAAPKVRRQRSSIFAQTNNRLSQLVSLSTMGTQNKLRKMRRPKSAPVLVTPGSASRGDESKADAVKYELPNGVERIGSGIGFTYGASAASKSTTSICSAPGVSKRAHTKLPTLGIGLGLRTFGGGILRTKTRREGPGEVERNQDKQKQKEPLGVKPMKSVPEDIFGEEEAEMGAQDVFRYGSPWSMMPEARFAAASSEMDQVSPATATDSTVFSPLTNLGPLSPLVGADGMTHSIIAGMRARDGVDDIAMGSTLRLVSS